MTKVFDEAYAKYLASLAKLDITHDISEKNMLFKQLTEQLSELEFRINNGDTTAREVEPDEDDCDPP